MGKKKLLHFAEITTFHNVVEHCQTSSTIGNNLMKGNWHREYFKNNNPIVLELGCGKGEYTIGLAKKNPNKNFIGVDLKGNRIWCGAKTALEENINNVAFVRTRIENIATVFEKNEVSEIWITFPDPQPQKTRIRKRLTNSLFLNKYKQILNSDGIIHLKTDSAPLYEYTLEVIDEEKHTLLIKTNDLYSDEIIDTKEFHEAQAIKTYYEKLFSDKGFKICYLQFKLNLK
jgi:tRNA (guanine-N7-)-methyltransferase